ncbi:FkbM family methyltransferase [Pseudogulbenkiania sp. NH8B]|uniref:FkbM family methyltransferase n=1 Tax=Pseudogulbenkiania sp. (strain NH8B) TaxID=748280 RepID=UPI0002279198|nr:FkbM family methyltransferase [Pseudogulbenkiania sp. NH8B]BAK75715.1 FkbM family methyltransferase [Pseudogulbenkiania sp. NH8B]
MLANRFDEYVGQALIQYGEYAELETQLLLQCTNRPGTVVEVGANIGSQTVPLAKAAKAVGADVMAFEPQPFVFQNLCANLALSAVDNVAAWPFACAMHPGTVWLTSPDYRRTGNFGAVSAQSQPLENGVQVPCVRLDDMTCERTVQLLKVDVEGFELQVLEGARDVLTNHRPILYVENDRVANSSALIQYLWGYGYRLWWHISPLFNPQNFRGNAENRYPQLYSFNMLGLPQESSLVLQGFEEIVDASAHPLSGRQQP